MKKQVLENISSNRKNKIDEVLIRYRMDKSRIVVILQDIALQLQILISQIYFLSTFYRAFSLKPKRKHLLTMCLRIACHVKGGQKIVEAIQKMFNRSSEETTKDVLFTLEIVNFLGACTIGHNVVMAGKYHGHINLAKWIN